MKISKLGLKIIMSYIVIVIVSTFIFLLTINNSIKDMMLYEKEIKTSNILGKIEQNIDKFITIDKLKNPEKEDIEIFGIQDDYNNYIKQNFDNKKQLARIQLPSSMFLDESDKYNIYIFNSKDELSYIFTQTKNLNSNIVDLDSKENFIKEKPLIYDDMQIGKIVLVYKEDKFKYLDKTIYKSIYGGFLFTLLISLVMALIFEMNIVGPITKLRANITRVSLVKKLDWEKVHTNDELEEINKELYHMTKKLQESNKNQKEFFQNTSHELKTPLMSIQGYAEAIKDGILEADETENALDIIIDESKNLSETITSVLYLSSMDKDEKYLNKEKKILNIFQKIENLKYTFEHKILENNIEIINNIPKNLSINTQEEKIDKVLKNLFVNALRYAKTKIIFNFYAENKQLHFLVVDDGRGFDEKDIDKIFDRFYKGEGGKNGLGLSIVKAIIKNSNGRIEAYNSKTHGAIIEIILPKSDNINY